MASSLVEVREKALAALQAEGLTAEEIKDAHYHSRTQKVSEHTYRMFTEQPSNVAAWKGCMDYEYEEQKWLERYCAKHPVDALWIVTPNWIKVAIVIGIGWLLFGLHSGSNPFGGGSDDACAKTSYSRLV